MAAVRDADLLAGRPTPQWRTCAGESRMRIVPRPAEMRVEAIVECITFRCEVCQTTSRRDFAPIQSADVRDTKVLA